MEEKLIKTLEFFLSLNEADEVYNLIINDDCQIETLIELIQTFTNKTL